MTRQTAARLKAFYAGINTYINREVMDLLGQPQHIRQAEMLIVAETKVAAIAYATTLWRASRWVGEPYRSDVRVADNPAVDALRDAGLFAKRAVFVMPITGGRGNNVVHIDENGPRLVGEIVHADGRRVFEPAGTLHVTFSPDQVSALHALLDLVHYDDIAQEWRNLLPAELLAARAVITEAGE